MRCSASCLGIEKHKLIWYLPAFSSTAVFFLFVLKMGPKRALCCISVDIDAVAGWLGSCNSTMWLI